MIPMPPRWMRKELLRKIHKRATAFEIKLQPPANSIAEMAERHPGGPVSKNKFPELTRCRDCRSPVARPVPLCTTLTLKLSFRADVWLEVARPFHPHLTPRDFRTKTKRPLRHALHQVGPVIRQGVDLLTGRPA